MAFNSSSCWAMHNLSMKTITGRLVMSRRKRCQKPFIPAQWFPCINSIQRRFLWGLFTCEMSWMAMIFIDALQHVSSWNVNRCKHQVSLAGLPSKCIDIWYINVKIYIISVYVCKIYIIYIYTQLAPMCPWSNVGMLGMVSPLLLLMQWWPSP